MNRRDFVKQAGVLSLAGLTAHPDGPEQSRGARLESASARLKHGPAWLADTPLVIAGNHDRIPIFMRRLGGGMVGQEEELFEESHTEDFARKIRDAGITLWITYYYKGFGVEAEKEYMEITKNFVPVLHRFGIKAGAYIGSTIAYETFLVERPDAADWLVPDYLGKPVIYFDQTFRRRAYFMHPGYVEYMKHVVHSAVADARVDLVHFDNTSLQAESEIFLHPSAIEDFRQYLKAKYTPQELNKRLGFSDVRYITPPSLAFTLTNIDDPLLQEWTGFRCYQLDRYYAIMEEVIRTANPETAVESNPHSEISGRNTIWEQGVYYPGLLSHMDAVWSEEGDPTGINDQGILVSRIRSFKNASILGNTLFVTTGGSRGSCLQMAESMAFGRQCIGDIETPTKDKNVTADQRRYLDFFHEQFDYYKDVQNIADVAVLYSYASMGFNNDGPAVSFMLFTQALIQAKVPFDIIYDEHLQDLSKYRALVLADQECLSEEQIEMIRRYVREGGGLVATEQTSLYTPWRLRRWDFGLRDLFGVAAPGWRGRGVPEENLKMPPMQKRVGRGRVSYIAAVNAAIQKPPGARMTRQYWKLPLNWEEMIEQVRWAAGGKFSLEVEAPETLALVAEQQEQLGRERKVVHLLNYSAPQGKIVSAINIEVELPEGKAVRQITLLTPDRKNRMTISGQMTGGRARFTVPHVESYTLAVLDLGPS